MTDGRSAGIVRPARRPLGWAPGGPRPPSAYDPRLGPHCGEDLCYLTGDFRILQRTGGHRWSLDDLLTAHFAVESVDAGAIRRFCDLGCGIGSVLMMLAWSFPGAHGEGLEAQDASVDLARRSLAVNGIDERCTVQHGDLRTAHEPAGPFDLVTGTPPYLPIETATGSSDGQRLACRLETRGGIEDYCRAAAARLGPGAAFVCCMSGTLDDRVGPAAEAVGLSVARFRHVIPREGKAPLFGLWHLRRAEEVRSTVELPPLVVRDARGGWTTELVSVRRTMGMPGAPVE